MKKHFFTRLLVTVVTLSLPAVAFANAELMKMSHDPNQWVMPLGNYASWRYSKLDQINNHNVDKLQVAWTFSTGVLRGHEGGPLVVGNTLYIVTPFPNDVFAINLDNLEVKWEYQPTQNYDETVPVMCCDTVNRGVAYAPNDGGMIFLHQADNTLVAINANNGKKIWSVKMASAKKGATGTEAPFVYHDKVFAGVSGGEFGVMGWIAAYNIKDGSLAWKCYNVGPDKGMCVNPEKTTSMGKPIGKDSSLKTWKGDQWKIGGGTTWGWYSFDPKLNLMYYGTSNPGTWDPVARPGDNKWSTSIWARNPDTGMARWIYQMTPHDQWDYDGVNEMVLVNMKIHGKMQKTLVHFDRNGFAYVLNRANGDLLMANKFDPAVNWAKRIDLKTGRPIKVAKYSPGSRGQNINYKHICPAALGSKDEQPSAYSPKTGLFYVPTNHVCMDYEPVSGG